MSLQKYYAELKNKLYFEGAFSFANFTLLNGIFLIGFALTLGANNLQLGILLAIPLLANLLQLVSAFILDMTGTKKMTTIVNLFFGRIVWVIIILLAFGVFTEENPITLLMAIVLVSSSFTAVGNLSLLSWMKDIVPLRKLASFWGKRNIYASIGGIVVYLAGAYIIDKFNFKEVYGYIFLSALIIGFIGLVYLTGIPDDKKKIKAINPRKFLKRLSIPLHDLNFRPLLHFGLLWGFAINIATPFFLVFMIEDLSLNFLIIAIFLVIDAVARIYGLSIWRKIADKFGAKPLLTVSATITSAFPLAFVFINNKNYFLIPIIFIIGAFSYAGVDIALGQIMFKSAPRKYDAYYISSYSSLINLASSIGPIIGGFLAFIIKNNNMPFMDFFPPLKYVFLFSFILRTISLPLIARIYEPKARDVTDIIEKMKTLKFVSFFVDIYSFTNHTSKVVLAPQKQFFILQRKTTERAKKDLARVRDTISKMTLILEKAYISPLLVYKKNLVKLKDILISSTDNLDFIKGGELKEIPKKAISKIESLESTFEEETKKVIKEEIKSAKNVFENCEKKLENINSGEDQVQK